MKILVTGISGFIGFHLAKSLAERGDEVLGIDNNNDYYDVQLKIDRLRELGFSENEFKEGNQYKSSKHPNLKFIKEDISNKDNLFEIFRQNKFDAVCNLAAQAGVRYSLSNPEAYMHSNFSGFLNILEACRQFDIENFSFASSSSVYGLNSAQPFSTSDSTDHPISLYAASKKSNEIMAHTYAHLYNIRSTGLRFFTVYGPWGRPDMALFLFTEAAVNNKKIDVYNNGNMLRDFTYIDDIINGVINVIDNPAKRDKNWNSDMPLPSSSSAPYKIYNIGNSRPIKLKDFIEAIEKATNTIIEKNYLPIQPGDVPCTFADVSSLEADFDYKPNTSVIDGIKEFVNWYNDYYKR